jgi:phage terminase large subunit-like protein
LQGRFEHGQVVLNAEGEFDEFVDQLLMFPTAQVHDDLPDALSYIDQLAVTTYNFDDADEEYECMDIISGY